MIIHSRSQVRSANVGSIAAMRIARRIAADRSAINALRSQSDQRQLFLRHFFTPAFLYSGNPTPRTVFDETEVAAIPKLRGEATAAQVASQKWFTYRWQGWRGQQVMTAAVPETEKLLHSRS